MVYTCSQYEYLYDYAENEIIAKKNKENGIDSSDDSSDWNDKINFILLWHFIILRFSRF